MMCVDNNIIIQAGDLQKINRTSVLFRDNSGYLAGLDVFHELHCLVRIKVNHEIQEI